MKKWSTPTNRSFLEVLLVTVACCCTALATINWLDSNDYSVYDDHFRVQYHRRTTGQQSVPTSTVSTNNWITYRDPDYPISFQYPSGWTLQTFTTNPDFYIIKLKAPGSKDGSRMYISPKMFFAAQPTDGKPYKIDGQPGFSINDQLFGATVAGYFYTFDVGLDLTSNKEFKAIVDTVKFDN